MENKTTKQSQQILRRRYVEFNFMHAQGTIFGLISPSPRIESISVSMPLHTSWRYRFVPEQENQEEKLMS